MEKKTNEFRQFLKDVFLERCRKNPSYSMRSFASSLKINHTTLSRILSGKRGMTKKMQTSLEEALNLSPAERRTFSKNEKLKVTKQYKDLSQDVFELIADWKYDCLLELPKIKNLKLTPRKIAKILGTNIIEVN
ncbi:MAG: hypothetical protein AB7I27_08100 [Bacteriovoracaceae bacterium]